MRELKFRAFDKKYKTMYYGDIEMTLSYPHEDIEIMQFTGLIDKDGRGIYEGDVVEWLGHEVHAGKQIRPERKFVVKWDFHELARLQNIVENRLSPIVIGNLYENPDIADKNAR